MKKLVAVILGLVSFSLAGPIATSFYATPTTTTNYNTATVKILGTGGGRIQVNGNITANNKIYIGDSSVNGSVLKLDSYSGGAQVIQFAYGGSPNWEILGRAIDRNLYFVPSLNSTSGSGAASAATFMLDDNGNVGIGTTAPSTKLEVAGTVSASALIVKASGALGNETNRIFISHATTPNLRLERIGNVDFDIQVNADNSTSIGTNDLTPGRPIKFTQVPQLPSSNVGSATATLGTASPATTTTPYRWLKFVADDGTAGWIPFWK